MKKSLVIIEVLFIVFILLILFGLYFFDTSSSKNPKLGGYAVYEQQEYEEGTIIDNKVVILNGAKIDIDVLNIFQDITNQQNNQSDNLITGFFINEPSEPQVAVIVKFKDEIPNEALDTLEENIDGVLVERRYSSFNGFAGNLTVDGFISLVNSGVFEAVYLDREYNIDLSDTKESVNATKVWPLIYNGINLTGAGETVCILDTGINYSHVNLGLLDCSADTFSQQGCGRVLAGYDFYNGDGDPYDDHGHGTHVAGIIASNASTYTGMAPGANMVIVKVCSSSGGCSGSAILSGIEWCIGNKSAYNITAISMSIGTSSTYSSYCDESSAFTDSINDATANNISVVIAAGNSGSSTGISEPACIRNAIAVSATDKSDGIASYSNRGSITDLFAPGTSITSTWKNGGFASNSGTSMATPHISGVFLLLQQYKRAEAARELTTAELFLAFNNTGINIYDSATGLNYSRVNVYNALKSVDSAFPVISILSPLNISYNYNNSILINFSINEVFLDSSFYCLDGLANISLSSGSGSILFTFVNLSEGSHNLIVYSNDSGGRLGFNNISFNVDLINPYIDVISPVNDANISDRGLDINYTASDLGSGIGNCWYSNDSFGYNYSLGNCGTNITDAMWGEGQHNVTIWVNDTANNINSTSVRFTIDTIAPYISITTPINNTFITNVNTTLNYTVLDIGVGASSCWYSNDSFRFNYSLTNCGTNITNIMWSEGQHNATVWVNDTANNLNSTSVRFTIDTIAPYVSIIAPANNGIYSRNVLVNITNNSDINAVWFFNGSANVSYSNFGKGVYLNLSEGNYNIIAYANDSVGNFNSSLVSISIDLNAPEISITNPSASSYFKSDFNVNVSAINSGAGISALYYRFENSTYNSSWVQMTNSSASLFNSIFSISGLSDSTYTLKIGASDILGNEAISSVSFSLDRVSPNLAVAVSSSAYSTSAVITYSSNEQTNSSINYGITNSLGSKSSSNGFVIAHSHTLLGLTASTLYYFNATFCDSIGNCNITGGYNFTTTAAAITSTDTTACAGGGAGGGGAGGGAGVGISNSGSVGVSQSWGSMQSGMPYSLEINKQDYTVQKVTVVPNKELANVQVVVRKLSEKPSSILRAPENVYSYFEIVKVNLINSDLSKGIILVAVDKNWVNAKGNKEGVKVSRYVGDKWEKLSTKYVSESNEKYTYEVTTPGFSYFAIAYENIADGKNNAISGDIVNEDNIKVANDYDINNTLSAKIFDDGANGYLWVLAVVGVIVVLAGLYFESSKLIKD